jgi:predicted lipoprotein with Yx(FWY)xxD motif
MFLSFRSGCRVQSLIFLRISRLAATLGLLLSGATVWAQDTSRWPAPLSSDQHAAEQDAPKRDDAGERTPAAPGTNAPAAEVAPASAVGRIWESTAAPAAEATAPPTVHVRADGVSLPAIIDERSYMVDLQGMTLYTFDGDTRPNVSTCFGVCETLWPPHFAQDGAKAIGEFSVVFRRDGSLQWAYRGKPLYRWARDTKPGDVTGDNVNGVWHLVRD